MRRATPEPLTSQPPLLLAAPMLPSEMRVVHEVVRSAAWEEGALMSTHRGVPLSLYG